MNSSACPFIKPIEIPKISIITSLYKGSKYIEHFLSEVSKQSVFDKCELIILDANSPEKEYLTINAFCEKHDNVIYKRLDSTPSVQETMNMGIDLASGDFLALWNIDDTRRYDALEIMAKTLAVDDRVELVYGDCLQTTKENETLEQNSANGLTYEHSREDFSKENMIKCLPGPLPIWKRDLNEKYGKFNEELSFAGDWEMWLRAVGQGAKFKKIHEVLGLYYFNPTGLSTSPKKRKERFAEEKQIFHQYKDIFGENVYNRFSGYFS